MDERDRQTVLEELSALRLTEEYRALANGTATPYALATLRCVRKHYAWRAAGRPGADPDQIQADLERIEHERRAFAEGYIPPWLVADWAPVLNPEETKVEELRLKGWPEPPVACLAVGSPPRVVRLSDGCVLGPDGVWREPEPGGDLVRCRAFGSTVIRDSDAATLQLDGSWKPAPRDPDLSPDVMA